MEQKDEWGMFQELTEGGRNGIMKKGDKAAIVCCSNALPHSFAGRLKELECFLEEMGLRPVRSNCIFEKKSVFDISVKERAQSLMQCYEDEDIRAIFDLSGGDIANEILPLLDYGKIAGSDKLFWGYSDLTTVINAIYAKTGRPSVLYQIRHLIGTGMERRREDFYHTVLEGRGDLFSVPYEWVRKGPVQGVVVGGNIRCLLKLAGTEYWPDMHGKILLLESFHGKAAQIRAYFSQLNQMGVFGQVNGILLGTFTELEETGDVSFVPELVRRYTGETAPILKTGRIGHGIQSKGIVIGREFQKANFYN